MLEVLDDLAKADGSGVRVAVVDSGVEGAHSWLGGRLRASYAVVPVDDDDYRVVETEPTDVCGHGTAAAGQVRRYAPAADLVSLRVLGGSLRATSQALLKALNWLVANPADVVNLSLSTQREQFALKIGHAVDDLYARNVTCICARGYHATGRAYPTYFASTVGVSYKKLPVAALEFRPNDLVEFDAPGVAVEIAWNHGETRVADGSSYACPLVSGLAARMLSVRPGLTPYEVKTLLKAYALRRAAGWCEPWMAGVERRPG